MTVIVIIGQVLLSVLAVLGAMLMWRALFDSFFTPASISAVVVIRTKAEADALELLLGEAEKAVFRRRGVPTVVLISPELFHGELGENGELLPVYQETVNAYDAVVYIGTERKQPSSE